MKAPRPSPEQLNAYVDGELSIQEAAAVARALADDRELAEQVAQISRLKAAVRESAEAEAIELPPARPSARRLPAVAASIAVAAFLGGALLIHQWQLRSEPVWLEQAWTLHKAWEIDDTAAKEAPGAGLLLASLAEVGPNAVIPDLTSARLTLSHASIQSAPTGRKALHLGYTGTRGCHVSLFIFPAGQGLPAEMTEYHDGPARAYGWRSGAGYLLLAQGMDRDRLALIAESVHRATLDNAPLGPETRTALARSRSESPPCLS